MLLDHDVDVDKADKWGRTPLIEACNHGAVCGPSAFAMHVCFPEWNLLVHERSHTHAIEYTRTRAYKYAPHTERVRNTFD
jgi:hypothetical protein